MHLFSSLASQIEHSGVLIHIWLQLGHLPKKMIAVATLEKSIKLSFTGAMYDVATAVTGGSDDFNSHPFEM